ncbi:MAG: DUF1056 family protein [Oenococcus sp.]|uniref:DUF1056 family protein n=1 Tax=Oenococcus sp. TaxID=1979414 RepID=UPI0039ED220F
MKNKYLLRVFKAIFSNFDGLLFFSALILLDTTMYLKSWFLGGIVTAVSLVVAGVLIEIASGQGSGRP